MNAIGTSGSSAVVHSLLAAEGPYAPLAAELMLFGRLIGSWDVEAVLFLPDGTRREQVGEWHFAWVLGGRAVQDVLFERGAPHEQRGTTLRAYDERSGVWHVTWMRPAGGEFVHLVARATDDGILLEGADADGSALQRWSFSELAPDSFRWRGHASYDDGATWTLENEMRARRR